MTRSVTSIINIQALKWEQRSRGGDEQVSRDPRLQRPTITISSEYGSLGQTIGGLVAGRLGFDLFDRDLLDRVAASANASRRVVESLDDRVQGWISEFIAGQFDNNHFTASDFLRHLSRAVLGIAHHGRAVIIGRGAHFILDREATLRVRTFAPLAARVAQVARDERLSPQEGRAQVLSKTAERVAFARLHFDRDISDPAHYDLILCTSTLSPELCAEIIARAFQSRFGSPEAGLQLEPGSGDGGARGT